MHYDSFDEGISVSKGFKPDIPQFSGNNGEFEKFRRSFISYARHIRLDGVFCDDAEDIEVRNTRVPLEELESAYGRDVVRVYSRAWQLLCTSLTGEVEQDILYRELFPRAASRALLEMHSPKTQGAKLALLEKIDSVTMDPEKDPIL